MAEMSRVPATDPFMRARPIVRRASATHHQIRQLRGKHLDGRYLVWPDGPTTADTGAIASAFDLSSAIALAKRKVPRGGA
jgi:hypothetical protein